MDDGGVALHPHPAPVAGQESVVLGRDLALHQHCKGESDGAGQIRLLRPRLRNNSNTINKIIK